MRATTLSHRDLARGAAPRPGSTPGSPQRQQHVTAVLAPHDTARPKAARPASGGWGLLASLQSAWSQRAPQQPARRVDELVQQVCAVSGRSTGRSGPLASRPTARGRHGMPNGIGGAASQARTGRRAPRLPCARAPWAPARLARPRPQAAVPGMLQHCLRSLWGCCRRGLPPRRAPGVLMHCGACHLSPPRRGQCLVGCHP